MRLQRALRRELLRTCLRSPTSAFRNFSTSGRRCEELIKPFYVTTPIYYVNAAPHIGHLYSSVIADIVARWSRLSNPDVPVIFATGTDEFGMKVQQAASAEGKEPQEFCDDVSQKFRDLATIANISCTRFIRTTEQVHQDAVQHVWRELVKRGHIYKGMHSGWYCVADECFYTEPQVEKTVDGVMVRHVSKESGRPVEWAEEENYMFRLCAFQQPLLDWLESNPQAIMPHKRYKEVVKTLEDVASIRDISVSRPKSRLQWGVPVPDDPDHTVYVWLDALINYLTVVGYPWRGEAPTGWAEGWPADVQVVGKDIVKFHAIYWPAFLMALGLEPPKQILAHAHWTKDNRKMSKSTGNVADPNEAMSKFGADAVRMYLCAVGGNLAEDADWSDERLRAFYVGSLRHNLGNLLPRIMSQSIMGRVRKCPFIYTEDAPVHEDDKSLHDTLQRIAAIVQEHVQKREFGHTVHAILYALTEANGYFTKLQPWRTTEPVEVCARGQFYAFETLRIAGILLQPFMPSKATQLLDILKVERRGLEAAKVGAEGEGAHLRVANLEILFPDLNPKPASGATEYPRKKQPSTKTSNPRTTSGAAPYKKRTTSPPNFKPSTSKWTPSDKDPGS
ncbi:hypothetical protein CALCODRAFT_439498 [Calocera cornea HHB12733]|uniref:Probable methionine--tRNA ligase, mitochondrial n=1 Tax=Calocera cornea HHB12733 TaxID=1353952 RepID=A0A165E032_9BASI|nr:hypothetical protein CALCODRAFT_439498 [Calocera cornea HHB12733]